jgi:two-component system nitrogen regulation response regulator NtrX
MASDILVVDDESDIRELVSGILQDEGFDTRTAKDSDSALTEIVSRRPSLVFLDIWLQGSRWDGLQLLDHIKQEHAELPVVMISGHGNIETAVAAIKRGAYDFIEKPFKADRLVLVAERALENSRLRREVKELKQLSPTPRRQILGHEPVAPDIGKGRADEQPYSHHRPVRLRQGTRRAHHSRAFAPFGRPLRRH